MHDRLRAPFGSWKSPITSDLAASTRDLSELALDGGQLYWKELFPDGRYAIMRRETNGSVTEVVTAPFNARTLVHEYGGGTFAVADGSVYFSNYSDQRLYRKAPGLTPSAITPEAAMRYADGVIDRERDRLICIREDHTLTPGEPVNTLVSISLNRQTVGDVLVAGNDFYSSPRLSPDGSHLAWLTWNRPNMPWDGAEVWVGELNANGSLTRSERVAGGGDESITQPEWSPSSILHFTSDRNGWWNLYRWREKQIEPMCDIQGEFGKPYWTLGLSSFAFESENRIICAYSQQSSWELAIIDTKNRELHPVKAYSDLSYVRAVSGRAAFVAGSQVEGRTIVQFDFATAELKPVYPTGDFAIENDYVSTPRLIEFPTSNGLTSWGFFYRPKNRDYEAPPNELPPLIVMVHGGPTNATVATFDLAVQYWTTRGFAVLDVNYGGSTGYGRTYRERLYGQWGVVDVDDCVNGALYLVGRGEVDGNRLLIRGRSAGGYTTLCALTFKNVFRGGASYYGISDLELWDKTTHKFESQYNRKLIGAYPDRRKVYRERSPLIFTDHVSCPILLLHGTEDKVVPIGQSELMVKALGERNLRFAYVAFREEQHGFRRKENIKRALEAELAFYSTLLGLPFTDATQPIKIENFESVNRT